MKPKPKNRLFISEPCDGYGSVSVTRDAEALQRRGIASTKDVTAVEHMTAEMESLLQRLETVVEAMSTALSSTATTPPAALAHTLQRHTEILHDYAQEFRKTRGSIASARERVDLLSGASRLRAENGVTNGSMTNDRSAHDALYAERTSLASSNTGADAAIQTGLSLKEDLDRQRAMFASMVERMETMSEGMPAINRLISQIRRKKKRDIFVLAGVVGLLLFITFTWKML